MSNIKYEILSLETFINTVKHIAAGEIGKELAYFTIYKNFSVIETLSNNNNTINIEIDKHQEGFTILSYNNSLYVTSVKDLSMKKLLDFCQECKNFKRIYLLYSKIDHIADADSEMRANNLKDEYYEYINDHPDAFIPKIYTTSSSKKSHVLKYEWKHIRNPMSFTVGEYTVVFSCHHFDETYTFIYKTDKHDIPEYKDMINILKYSIARRDQI